MRLPSLLSKRPFIGHTIRWLLIVLLSLFILRFSIGSKPWSLDHVASQALSGMEMPQASIVSRISDGHGIQSVLMLDRKYALLHHFFVSHPLGILWQNRGGSYGIPLDTDVQIDLKMGMSALGSYRHYYYIGQVNDIRIADVRVLWGDGFEQKAHLTEGVYQAVRAIKASDDSASDKDMSARVQAFDLNGLLLYELTSEQREIRGSDSEE